MEILPQVEIKDLALYFKELKLLAVSDFHIGYEEALNKQGILIPRFQFQETVQRLEKILKSVHAETIVICGDLKHEFGRISETEWRQTLKVLDLMNKYCKKIILLKGNHDTILEPISTKRNLEIKEYYVAGGCLFLHGDKLPEKYGIQLKEIKAIIIGHEHPALGLKERARVERYKCFLKGSYKRKQLIVLPSFNLVVEGSDVLKERLLSPLLPKDIGEMEVFIVADKVYSFGKIKGLRKME